MWTNVQQNRQTSLNLKRALPIRWGFFDEVSVIASVARDASQLGIPFLGGIPLHMDIRVLSDSGTPIVFAQPNLPQAKAYQQIEASIWTGLKNRVNRKAA